MGLDVKSDRLYPYFFMCCQCLATASPISQIKQIRRKGQQTGTRNIQNQVHTQANIPMLIKLFQRLNSFRDLRTGRSPSELRSIERLSSRKRVFYASSSSGSGRPEGVRYCTSRQITYRPMMYMRPRYSQRKIRYSRQAQRKKRYPQR